MRLTFLGKATQGGGSPTLFATDRNSYVVQGWKVAGKYDSVEIPQRLLAHLEPGTYLGALLSDTGRAVLCYQVSRLPMRMRCHRWTFQGMKRVWKSQRKRRFGSMELLQGGAFEGLFHSFAHTAFHLEVQDSYYTPDEAGPFELFLSGQPDDLAWHQPWLDLVQSVTGGGKKITRARVITVPHVDYTRWGLTVTPFNIAAGEDVRWLPRHLIDDEELTTDDYWLFDDRVVVFTVFEPSGQFSGGAATTDPVIVAHCRRVRDRVWQAAIPHSKYLDSDYVSA